MRHSDGMVVGLGEVGRPLLSVLEKKWDMVGRDVHVDPHVDTVEFLHLCFPFQVDDFVQTALGYLKDYEPKCTIVHSTVPPGTTQSIRDETEAAVFYSPVRGKHRRMEEDLLSYTKFVSGPDAYFDAVRDHLVGAKLQVARMEPTEALETAKLLETTYFGVLIAWAQEVQRFAESIGTDHETLNKFVEEIEFLPSDYFPGHIGGHCVMPNIELLSALRSSEVLDWIRLSNQEYEVDN